MRVLVHAPGPPEHGVVRHAHLVARRVAGHGVRTVTAEPQLTHTQFTDALWGPDIAAAADAFVAWAQHAPRPLVVTLHDVPGADDDPARDARRGVGYARVVAACDAVVVSAAHEAAKIERLTGRVATVVDLPVPLPVPGGADPAWADRPSIGVLGFVYPGKGHADAVDAAARHRMRLVAAGGTAPGHGALLRGLHARADAAGVDLVVTGPLSDADLAAAARAVTVPLAPSRTVSASGTLMTWRGCGRRPFAAAAAYATELAARHTGTLHLYRDATELDAGIAAARTDPMHTVLATTAGIDPAGPAHAALYRGLLAC